ncbi:MucR family transcriptional regulator [Methylobacterium nigriterrae]|uniref:MucR family transcriptional regulator n=1 Tax=Methylobacterium nigriterrae TaxID=3127512 RepID=UPI0030138A8D
MDESTETQQGNHLELTSDIVAAYLSNNHVAAAEIPALIAQVHSALAGLGQAAASNEPAVTKPTAAQIKKSITHDALISFEDGKPYKTLRRHLTIRGLTPEAYREKHGLPRDYPMVAASYSEQRSSLAKSLGLGQQRRKLATKAAGKTETVSEAPKSRGSRKKSSASPSAPASTPAPAKGRSRKKALEAAE